jgi:hypothetical protein
MEWWNNGMMEGWRTKTKNKSDFGFCGLPNIPIFHYSSIPKGVFV